MKINRKQLQEIIAEQLVDSDPTVYNYPSTSYGERTAVDRVDRQELSGDEIADRKFTDDQLIDMIVESLRCPTSGLAALSNNPGIEVSRGAKNRIVIDRKIYDPSANGGKGDFSVVLEAMLEIL